MEKGGCKKGGGACEVLPQQKGGGGAENVLAMLKGVRKKCPHFKRGVENFHPFFGGGAAKSFGLAIFPLCSPPLAINDQSLTAQLLRPEKLFCEMRGS